MPAFFPEELASGQLVQPFPILRQADDFHYWLVYPEVRRRAAKVRAFRDWILNEVVREAGRSGTAGSHEALRRRIDEART
jgi:LysR family glycine cleavage system transcriptional activator